MMVSYIFQQTKVQTIVRSLLGAAHLRGNGIESKLQRFLNSFAESIVIEELSNERPYPEIGNGSSR